jgi:membrane associated rhomboid family serine protease
LIEDDLPEWARSDAFPASPATASYGWLDHKGRRHECASVESLAGLLDQGKASQVELVWTPASPRLVVPEEVPELRQPLLRARLANAEADVSDARRNIAGFGILAALLAGHAWWRSGWSAIMADSAVGMALLFWVMFGWLPWYQAWQARRLAARPVPSNMDEEIADARFDVWLMRQRAWATWSLLVLLGITGLLQLLPGDGWRVAGLLKDRYAAGEWWRLLTAPWLHGGIVHWLLNATALLYLGRRTEVLARWPHLLLVFLVAALGGGVASARFVTTPSVGASGGLLGLLGFLLVFEALHRKLVPVSTRQRLLGGIVATAVIGVLGFRFIDNAAHAGGLLAGLGYGAIVFFKSSSAQRPRVTVPDAIAGVLAALLLVAGAALAWFKMVF